MKIMGASLCLAVAVIFGLFSSQMYKLPRLLPKMEFPDFTHFEKLFRGFARCTRNHLNKSQVGGEHAKTLQIAAWQYEVNLPTIIADPRDFIDGTNLGLRDRDLVSYLRKRGGVLSESFCRWRRAPRPLV